MLRLSPNLSSVCRFVESQKSHHTIHEASPPCGRRVDLRNDVEAVAHRLDDAYSESLGGGRDKPLVVAPDEDGAGARIADDVETVFRQVVDDDVEAEGGGDASARTLDDEDARQRKASCFEPPLRLHLRCGTCALGTSRQKNHFPSALSRDRGKARDGARLDFLERLPEVLDRRDVPPQSLGLARR